MLLLMIKYCMKTMKLVVIILLIVYGLGLMWVVYCDLTLYFFKVEDAQVDNFFNNDRFSSIR